MGGVANCAQMCAGLCTGKLCGGSCVWELYVGAVLVCM